VIEGIAAVHASKLGAKVAIIEKKASFGGPTGLTSKAVREATKRFCGAIEQIGGDRRRQIGGLWRRKFPALRSEAEALQAKETRDRIVSNNIDLFVGEGEIVGSFPIADERTRGTTVRVLV
jgi:pyruvate/2-oxoglutarate dehydrogenase complex dihydrolipoamide dehydrogenase (E3) component